MDYRLDSMIIRDIAHRFQSSLLYKFLPVLVLTLLFGCSPDPEYSYYLKNTTWQSVDNEYIFVYSYSNSLEHGLAILDGDTTEIKIKWIGRDKYHELWLNDKGYAGLVNTITIEKVTNDTLEMTISDNPNKIFKFYKLKGTN